jgi:hypothetical protein
MPKIVITGVPGIDGEYPLELVFTHRDFRTIKQVAGVRASEVMEAINAGDLDVIVALAEIAMRRSGKAHNIDDLWDSEAGSISLDVTDEEDAVPPPQPAVSENGAGNEPSGVVTSLSTADSPETSSPPDSGIPEPVSTSDPLTSTT